MNIEFFIPCEHLKYLILSGAGEEGRESREVRKQG